jgi:hypothetical protein
VGAAGVYCYGEVTAEEGKVEATVAKALDKAGASLKVSRGPLGPLNPNMLLAHTAWAMHASIPTLLMSR